MVISSSFGGQDVVESAARKLGTATSSRPAFWTDAWTPDNSNAAYPNPYYNSTYDLNSSFWFKSSTQIRMTNINIAYTLPGRWTDKLGMQAIKVYANAINAFNFYNPYSYKDNSLGSFDAYPVLRSFSFGLNLGF